MQVGAPQSHEQTGQKRVRQPNVSVNRDRRGAGLELFELTCVARLSLELRQLDVEIEASHKTSTGGALEARERGDNALRVT